MRASSSSEGSGARTSRIASPNTTTPRQRPPPRQPVGGSIPKYSELPVSAISPCKLEQDEHVRLSSCSERSAYVGGRSRESAPAERPRFNVSPTSSSTWL